MEKPKVWMNMNLFALGVEWVRLNMVYGILLFFYEFCGVKNERAIFYMELVFR